MLCENCGTEVTVYSGGEGTNSYEPVKKVLQEMVTKYNIPFYCTLCGCVKFKYQATRDIVFVWPDLRQKKIGLIYVPDKWQHHTDYGVVVSVGPGTLDNKKKRYFVPTTVKVGDYVLYDKSIPMEWAVEVEGVDGKMHTVKFMGEQDIKGIVCDE